MNHSGHTQRRYQRISACFFTFVLTLALGAPALAASAGQAARPGARNAQPKLDAAMAAIADAPTEQAAADAAKSRAARMEGGRVQAQITTRPASQQAAARALRGLGANVSSLTADGTLIQAWLPANALERAAAHPDVLFIRQPEQVTLYAGTSMTEGFAALNGAAWHAAGQQGAGTKVAIIDGGFQGYASLLGADLPSGTVAKNFVDGQTDAQLNTTDGQHGTACAEIVYDIAPQAQIYLIKIATPADLDEAVTWLISQRVNIISTSLGWYNVTPGDGTGVFANIVSRARANGIFWTTAASNDRQAHWGGAFADGDADSIHNFSATQETNYFVNGDGTLKTHAAGEVIRLFVRWDDWTSVNQDFDLYLVRKNGATWDNPIQVSKSENWQGGSAGQTPTEQIVVQAPVAGNYGFYIKRYSATRAVNFELFAPKSGNLALGLTGRSLGNLADSPDALTVAALHSASPYAQESYSSEGPANGPGGTATGGAIKPDIAAYANVATEAYKPFLPYKFNGTSAATPHVAGAAALVLGANPGFTPAQIRSFLETRAIDMGAAGKDSLYGFGRLNLGSPTAITTVFGDDFETVKGWTANAGGADTATFGRWERGDPEATSDASGAKQLGIVTSGSNALVTGRLAGASVGEHDLDNGTTTIRSPNIVLPASGNLSLSFIYYLAHASNAGSDDYLRVRVVGSTSATVLQVAGAAANRNAAWTSHTASLNSFAGQTVYIQIEAADAGAGSLLEAALDDLKITRQ